METFLAAMVGAVVGGLVSLWAAERTLQGSIKAARDSRDAAQLAALRALAAELVFNADMVDRVRVAGTWLPLQRTALDTVLTTLPGRVSTWPFLPEPVQDANHVISEYNALAAISNMLAQSNQRTVRDPLDTYITEFLSAAKPVLTEAARDVALAGDEWWLRAGAEASSHAPWWHKLLRRLIRRASR